MASGHRRGLVGPDAHVVLLEAEPDAVVEVERVDVRPRQLEPAGPVDHRVLLGDHPVVAALGLLGPPERLGARPAVADGHRPLDLLRDEGVVGHDHDGRAQLAVDPSQQAEHVARRLAVELARRLVGEHDVGVVGEGHRDRGPLLLAAAEPVGPVGRAVLEPDEVQQLERARLPPLPAVEDHRHLDVLGGGEVRQQVAARLLPDEPDDAPPEPRPLRVRRAARGRSRRRPPAPRTATSMPPRMLSSVDLPLPEAPTMAIISPPSTSRSRPWSATTSSSACL